MLIFEACPALFGLPAGLVQDGLYGVMISCGEEIGRDWVGGGHRSTSCWSPLLLKAHFLSHDGGSDAHGFRTNWMGMVAA